jgi:adenosine deaminase
LAKEKLPPPSGQEIAMRNHKQQRSSSHGITSFTRALDLLRALPLLNLNLAQMQKLRKIVHHEHYDCSIRPEHVLRVGTALDLNFPAQFKDSWRNASDVSLLQAQAADQFQSWIHGKANSSLTDYLNILWEVVLPTLQTRDHLYQTAKQRIDDATDDGISFLKLRFAPQLHRRQGLKLQQVIDPLQQAVSEAPMPVRLAVCALRHENGRLARKLADTVIRNPLVTTFDLAGDEAQFPGVLPWWAKQAKRVADAGKQVTCHIGEANPITSQDHLALDKIGCVELAHGIKGDPRKKLCTVCLTSNLVTHLLASPEQHPIDPMYRQGQNVHVDLDGTLFTRTTQSREYLLIHQTFDWQLADFLRCEINGWPHIPVDASIKRKLKSELIASYLAVATELVI